MLLRKAQMVEAKVAYQCIVDARAYHNAMGFVQWHPEYPTLATIEDDIKKSIGYVFEEGNEIYGYCCIIIGDESAYRVIDGEWKTNRPYAVVHRMAFSQNARGKGLSKDAFTLIKNFCIENGIESIRVDTQDENKVIYNLSEDQLLETINGPFYSWVGSNVTYNTSMSTSSTPTFTRRYLYSIGTKHVYEEMNLTTNPNFPDWFQEDLW